MFRLAATVSDRCIVHQCDLIRSVMGSGLSPLSAFTCILLSVFVNVNAYQMTGCLWCTCSGGTSAVYYHPASATGTVVDPASVPNIIYYYDPVSGGVYTTGTLPALPDYDVTNSTYLYGAGGMPLMPTVGYGMPGRAGPAAGQLLTSLTQQPHYFQRLAWVAFTLYHVVLYAMYLFCRRWCNNRKREDFICKKLLQMYKQKYAHWLCKQRNYRHVTGEWFITGWANKHCTINPLCKVYFRAHCKSVLLIFSFFD